MFKIAVGIVVLVLLAVGAAVALRLRAGRDTSATQPTTAKAPGKVAIVYYSQSKVRNTALIAKWIQKHLGGDLIEIETVEPYPPDRDRDGGAVPRTVHAHAGGGGEGAQKRPEAARQARTFAGGLRCGVPWHSNLVRDVRVSR